MEKKDFEKVFKNVLAQYGFHYKNKAYYFENDEIIIVIATQKSNYEKSYYINFGFLVKDLSPNMKYPKDNACDVFGRFVLEYKGEQYHSVDLDSINVQNLSSLVKSFVDANIKPVMENGLSKYLEINPKAIFTATLKQRTI